MQCVKLTPENLQDAIIATGSIPLVLSGVRDYEIRVDVSADELLKHGLSLPAVHADHGCALMEKKAWHG